MAYIPPNIPRHLADKVARELEPDEQIAWIDMPIPRFFTPASTSAFVFAIPWTAFSLFWIAGASGFRIPDFNDGFDLFPLFGVPFTLIGIALLSSPIWAYRKASKTVYVITDRRAVSFDGGRSMTIRSYLPQDLKDVYRKEKSSDEGDVIIARRAWRDSDGDQQTEELGFLRIKNPKQVERLIRGLAEQARGHDQS